MKKRVRRGEHTLRNPPVTISKVPESVNAAKITSSQIKVVSALLFSIIVLLFIGVMVLRTSEPEVKPITAAAIPPHKAVSPVQFIGVLKEKRDLSETMELWTLEFRGKAFNAFISKPVYRVYLIDSLKNSTRRISLDSVSKGDWVYIDYKEYGKSMVSDNMNSPYVMLNVIFVGSSHENLQGFVPEPEMITAAVDSLKWGITADIEKQGYKVVSVSASDDGSGRSAFLGSITEKRRGDSFDFSREDLSGNTYLAFNARFREWLSSREGNNALLELGQNTVQLRILPDTKLSVQDLAQMGMVPVEIGTASSIPSDMLHNILQRSDILKVYSASDAAAESILASEIVIRRLGGKDSPDLRGI